MKLTHASAFVLAMAILCGMIGMGIGNAIGTLMPGYYQAVIRTNPQQIIDPVAIGRGLGLTQGLAAGVGISLALVIVFAWISHRGRIEQTLEAIAKQLRQLQERVDRLEQLHGKE